MGGTQPQAADYLKHAVNLGIMFFDVWCSRAPFVSYHFQVCPLQLYSAAAKHMTTCRPVSLTTKCCAMPALPHSCCLQ